MISGGQVKVWAPLCGLGQKNEVIKRADFNNDGKEDFLIDRSCKDTGSLPYLKLKIGGTKKEDVPLYAAGNLFAVDFYDDRDLQFQEGT